VSLPGHGPAGHGAPSEGLPAAQVCAVVTKGQTVAIARDGRRWDTSSDAVVRRPSATRSATRSATAHDRCHPRRRTTADHRRPPPTAADRQRERPARDEWPIGSKPRPGRSRCIPHSPGSPQAA